MNNKNTNIREEMRPLALWLLTEAKVMEAMAADITERYARVGINEMEQEQIFKEVCAEIAKEFEESHRAMLQEAFDDKEGDLATSKADEVYREYMHEEVSEKEDEVEHQQDNGQGEPIDDQPGPASL